MAVIVLLSPGGAPGVTTTALALGMSWPRDVILAECDPAGGTVMAGLWRGQHPAVGNGGLMRFALAAQRDPRAAAGALRDEALPLQDPPGHSFVLPLPPGPLPVRRLATAWPAVAVGLASAGEDVIADVGRFDGDPGLAPLLARAARVLMVCRPLIRQAAAAKPRLEALARIRAARPAAELLLTGTGPYGGDAPKAFAQALGVPVLASLPWDPATAGALSDGAPRRRGFGHSPLMRAAAVITPWLARDTAARPAPGAPAEAPR